MTNFAADEKTVDLHLIALLPGGDMVTGQL